jgi:hypothetical protein
MNENEKLDHVESPGAEDPQPAEPPLTPPYSDIDLNRWRDYDHVWTDSLWPIDSRDATRTLGRLLRSRYLPTRLRASLYSPHRTMLTLDLNFHGFWI